MESFPNDAGRGIDWDPPRIKLRGTVKGNLIHTQRGGGKGNPPFSCETSKHSCYPSQALLKRNYSERENNNSKNSNSNKNNNSNSSQPFAGSRHPLPRAVGGGRITLAVWFEFDLNHFEYI